MTGRAKSCRPARCSTDRPQAADVAAGAALASGLRRPADTAG